MRKYLYAAAATAALLAGCSTDTIGSASFDSTDSFFNPTHHGDLAMGEPTGASFTSTQRFHAWSFELTDDASVVLETMNLANNVDTVMYLYATDAQGEVTGSNIAKNDDTGDELRSMVERNLGAGHYMVLVKAHKTQITGGFQVQGTCSGAGCPQIALPPTFDEMCDLIDDGVADCVFDGGSVDSCAPVGDGDALMCCNARNDNYCDTTCQAAGASLDFELENDYGDEWGGVTDASGYVASVCYGVSFDDVIDSARTSSSDLLDQYDEDAWGTGEEVDRAGMDTGILYDAAGLLEELDAAAQDDFCVGWTDRIEVPCQNCEQYIEKWVIHYPNTGATFEIEGTYGWD